MLRTMADTIKLTQAQILTKHKDAIIMGLGVNDPKGVFGTTTGLNKLFPDRVFETPISENAMTGVCIGASLNGLRPIHVHQRMDFSLYAADQIINNAAKWYSMFGGKAGTVPIIIRMIVGRGWGQGNQHSQNLTSLFKTVPGLKIFTPWNAYTAKGLLIRAFNDPNPVIFVEHRWLHNTTSEVPDEDYECGDEQLVREGSGWRTASGYDVVALLNSKKHKKCAVYASLATQNNTHYPPATPGLIKGFYPYDDEDREHHDVPNSDFTGPF